MDLSQTVARPQKAWRLLIAAAQQEGVTKLKDTMTRLDTPPDISIAMTHGLERWTQQEDRNSARTLATSWPPSSFPCHPIDHRPIADAFTEQSETGWEEFARGRLSKRWGRLMEQHCRNTAADKTKNRLAWETTMIAQLLDLFDNIWEKRNRLKFGENEDENKELRHQQLNEDITRACHHERPTMLPSQARKLFRLPLQLRLRTSLTNKDAWLRTIRTAQTAWARAQADDPPDPGSTNDPPPSTQHASLSTHSGGPGVV